MTSIPPTPQPPRTAPATGTGNESSAGFTLVELMVVMLILTLLASLGTPLVSRSIQRAREAALQETLAVTRKAIDDYYADAGEYPADLKSLVDKRYLRRLPQDPIADSADAWKLVRIQGDDGRDAGIADLHSSAEGRSLSGALYADW